MESRTNRIRPDGAQGIQKGQAKPNELNNKSKMVLRQHIPLILWVSSSPELSPIKTLQNKMKKRLPAHPVRTVPCRIERLQQILDYFTPQDCQTLMDTMPRRIEAVIHYPNNCFFVQVVFSD